MDQCFRIVRNLGDKIGIEPECFFRRRLFVALAEIGIEPRHALALRSRWFWTRCRPITLHLVLAARALTLPLVPFHGFVALHPKFGRLREKRMA